MESYDKRAETLGFTSKDEVKEIAKKENTVFLDVRSEAEVAEATLQGYGEVIYVPCTRDDASLLKEKANELLPDKNANVIVFCRSGARAVTAKQALSELGYTNLYNAGGLGDLDFLSE